MSRIPFVLALEEVRPGHHEAVGGKAAGCARLMHLGLLVPRGWVLTTRAFDAFLEQAGLAALRTDLLEAFRTESSEEVLRARCEEFQTALRRADIGQEALADLRSRLNKAVAVRSSITVEDGASTSFAGIFHTELSVNADGFWTAVRKCWASAFGYSAVTHALRNNIDPAHVRPAVLVQEMIPADYSGVLFTRDPCKGFEEALLSWVRGTGDELMRGERTGILCRIDRRTGEPLDPTDLPPDLFRRLVRTGLRIERKLGHPQDIEWAAHAEEIFFLQTRSITTVETGRASSIVWTRELTEERFPKPISPLGWSTLESILPVNLETLARRFGLVARRPDEVARTIRHYVYSNEGFFAIPSSLIPNPLAHARFLPRYLLAFVEVLIRAPFLVGRRFGLRWLFLARFFKSFIFPHAREIQRSWDRDLPGLIREMDAFTSADVRRMSLGEIWSHRQNMETVARRYMEPDLAIFIVKMACSWMLEALGERLQGQKKREFLTDLTSAVVDNRTLEMNADLEDLLEAFEGRPELRSLLNAGCTKEILGSMTGEIAHRFDRFLERNGHTTTNWDLREPTWGEAPHLVLQMLRCFGSVESRRSFRDLHAQRIERFHAVRDKVRSSLDEKASWLVPFFGELLATLHEFMRIDEEHHFYCSRLFRPMRRVTDEVGSRLAAAQVIEKPEDIYFLTIPEIHEVLGSVRPFSRRYLIHSRRESFRRSESARPPHRFRGPLPLPDGETPLNGDILLGVGASAGVVSGVVRVIESPEDVAAFQPGEVLVTTSPNPAWTPLYAAASALVTSAGSLLSHGLVCAREYQMPAVIGIPDVTRKLFTGQRIKVDGDQGTVSVELA